MYGSMPLCSSWCCPIQLFHSAWTAARKVAMDRLATVTLSEVRLSRSVDSQVPAMPSWRASCALRSLVIAAHARAIAGSVGAQRGMSTLAVLVTVGLVTVAVVTPSLVV